MIIGNRMASHGWQRLFGGVRHAEVLARVERDSGWSGRFAFMTLMSAAIAMLGMLLPSPVVVIGAMLISPLMGPILGLGFALATFDFPEMRRTLGTLALGSLLAIGITALIVLFSPLKEATSEIVTRTRPNLFDLLVALFSSFAGTYALIRGGGGTIVGVALATALMPPLAAVGYGMAMMDPAVMAGAVALFATNFVTIALSATIVARLYGFGHELSDRQSWTQTIVLLAVFVLMAVPLGFALKRIATEAVITTETRAFLGDSFGPSSRVSQLDIDFKARPIAIRSVIIAPAGAGGSTPLLQRRLSQELSQPLSLRISRVLLAPGADADEAQRAELAVGRSGRPDAADTVTAALAAIAGVSTDRIVVDRQLHHVLAPAARLPEAGLGAYLALERRVAATAEDWTVELVPPAMPLPLVRPGNGDTIDGEARKAVEISAWAARRWNMDALGIPGLPQIVPEHPTSTQSRALAMAAIVRRAGLRADPAPMAGPSFRLSPSPAEP